MPGGTVITRRRTSYVRCDEDIGNALKRESTSANRWTPHSAFAYWRRGMFAVACLTAMVVASMGQCLAQDRDGGGRPSALGATMIVGPSPRLQVPSVIIGAPATEASLGLAIGRDGTLPSNTYVRIRGLGSHMTLTSGHVIAPGAWAVPIAALPDLRVVIPAGAAGKTEVHVALVAIDGGVIAEAQTTLVVAGAAFDATTPAKSPPAPVPPPAPPPAALPPPTQAQRQAPNPAMPAAPSLPAADRERAEGFLARGRTLLASGNIASARLFFRRAADAGLADGALAMGDTFDPIELSRLHAISIHADPAEARRWYEKARELGAGSVADRRLDRLSAR